MYVGFHRGTSLFDRLIQWWTRGPFSHSELIFPNGDRHTSLPGVGTGWQPPVVMIDGAPAVRSGWVVGQIDADDERARQWCNDHCFDRYDWSGIFFSQIFPMKSQAGSRYWCTEANVEALQYGYCLALRGIDSRLMNPNSLYKLLSSAPSGAPS